SNARTPGSRHPARVLEIMSWRYPGRKPGAPLRRDFRADGAAIAFAPTDGGTHGASARGLRHRGPRGHFRSPPGRPPYTFRCRVSAKAHAFRHGVSSKM